MSKIVHVSFYFSNLVASEYIAAYEQRQLLIKTFGNKVLSIVADLDKNINYKNTVKLKSLIKNQDTLYRYTDLLPQFFWHFRVFIQLLKLRPNKVFISGLMPWHPIYLYALLKSDVTFMGVGGSGEVINKSFFEIVRKIISLFNLFLMRFFNNNIVIIPRTTDAELLWKDYTGNLKEIIPERVNPLKGNKVRISSKDPIKFVWIGQDIKRKDLSLALEWYNCLKSDFPKSELHVFGANRNIKLDQVKFHGWVNELDLLKYGSKWALLLSSKREGLPSSVIEVLKIGGAIISRDIGSIKMLKSKRVLIIENLEDKKELYSRQLKCLFKKDVIDVLEETFIKNYKKILL